jgi:hypothetical protein
VWPALWHLRIRSGMVLCRELWDRCFAQRNRAHEHVLARLHRVSSDRVGCAEGANATIRLAPFRLFRSRAYTDAARMTDPLPIAAAAALVAVTPPSGSQATHRKTTREGRVHRYGDTHLVRGAVGALPATVDEILFEAHPGTHESPFGRGFATCLGVSTGESRPARGGTAIGLTVSARSTDPVADARPEVMDLSRSTGGPITNAATPEMARQCPAALAVVVVLAAVALPQATHFLIRTQILVLPTLRSLVLQSWGPAAEGALALTLVPADLAPAAIRVAVAARPLAAPLLALGRTVPRSEQHQGSPQNDSTQEPGHTAARPTRNQRSRERIKARSVHRVLQDAMPQRRCRRIAPLSRP